MAKRGIICHSSGRVLRSLSARHNDAAEELEHLQAFFHDNLVLLAEQFPAEEFYGFEVTTRRGEDEAVLHANLHRLRAELKTDASGRIECLDIALELGEARHADGRYGDASYSVCTSKPRAHDLVECAYASANRRGRAALAAPGSDVDTRAFVPALRAAQRRPVEMRAAAADAAADVSRATP